jgi:hypothetical protein
MLTSPSQIAVPEKEDGDVSAREEEQLTLQDYAEFYGVHV